MARKKLVIFQLKIVLPNVNEFVQPILYSIPVQLIAYFVAVKNLQMSINEILLNQ